MYVCIVCVRAWWYAAGVEEQLAVVCVCVLRMFPEPLEMHREEKGAKEGGVLGLEEGRGLGHGSIMSQMPVSALPDQTPAILNREH